MKNLKRSMLAIALIGLITLSCKKEEVIVDTSKEVVHNYAYNETTYSITFKMDENDEVIKMKGDLDTHFNLFNSGTEESQPKVVLVEDINEENLTYSMRFFDTCEDMDNYQERMQQIKIPTGTEERWWWCTTWRNSGSASFRFYTHTNYVSEITSIQELNVSYFQRDWLNNPTENDAISSIQLSGSASVDLFANWCFGGTQIRFTSSIANLHDIMIFNSYGEGTQYIGYQSWWHPGTGTTTNYNFGDQTSAIKGWSL